MSLRAAHFAAKQSPLNEAEIATPPHLPSHSLRFGDCVAGGARAEQERRLATLALHASALRVSTPKVRDSSLRSHRPDVLRENDKRKSCYLYKKEIVCQSESWL
jgi:hypothetical protein